MVEKHVGIADLDALAIGNGRNRERLVAAIALNGQDIEADAHLLAMAVAIDGREIAQDSVADIIAFGIDGDGFAHRQRGVGIHRHVAEKIGDALFRRRRERKSEKEAKPEQQRAHGRQPYFLKSTFGTSRAAASPISKNSALAKWNMLAMMLVGKDSIMVLRLRTVPL